MKTPQTGQPLAADDHPLLARDLAGVRLLLLEGASGSGKSTAIAALLVRHAAFAGLARTEVHGAPIAWRGVRVNTPLVVVDELTRAADALAVVGLLARGHRVIAASHLPGAWLAPFGARLGVLRFVTDADPGTIERYLRARGVRCSPAALAHYCRRFGATYTDADMILAHDGGHDFDVALARFERCCSVRMTPHSRVTEVRVVA